MQKNKTLIQFFEWYIPADAGHWKRFRAAIPELQSLGITAAWLPPAYKGTRGPESEGYDVYDIFDLGEFDQKKTIATKYGTKQEYIDAVSDAREAGLQVYIDVVLNHMGGAEELEKIRVQRMDSANRLKPVGAPTEIEAYTKFRFSGRNGQHSQFQWDHHCFTGIDYAHDLKENAIFSIINEFGASWEPMVHNEKGNFDFLILNDIETRNPAVRAEFKKWISWYYNTVAFDGVRLDAVKHMNPAFFIEWIDYLKQSVNKDLFVVGEFWLSDDLPVLLRYLDAVGNRMSLFDAPLQHNFSIASEKGEAFDMRKILDDTLVSVRPDLAVTFVDNHDTQPLQSLEEYTLEWFRPHGYALILLREGGYPCVFYADLYGSSYSGMDKNKKMKQVHLPVLEVLPLLMKLRTDYAYGRQTDYFDAHDCIGWTRAGVEEIPGSGIAVLLCNKADGIAVKKMHVGSQHAGAAFYNFLEQDKEVEIDAEGYGEFRVIGAAVAVWVRR